MTKYIPMVLVTLLIGLTSLEARADKDITIFYSALAPHGTWHYVDGYGRVWKPAGVERQWRPYTRGHWVHTEDGWMWASDFKDWGWAPFHYGRWVEHRPLGWVWVPGRDWAPAWVSWRGSDDHVAWAPLPPRGHGRWQEVSIPSAHWTVLPATYLGRGTLVKYYLPPRRARVVWPSTRVVYRARPQQHIEVPLGPTVEYVRRTTRRPVVTVSINVARKPRRHGIKGRIYTVYRPSFSAAPRGPKVRVRARHRVPASPVVRVKANPVGKAIKSTARAVRHGAQAVIAASQAVRAVQRAVQTPRFKTVTVVHKAAPPKARHGRRGKVREVRARHGKPGRDKGHRGHSSRREGRRARR